MADDWISEVNAHSDVNCWCRGTHAEGLHSIWERRRDADQLRAENADLRARLAEVEALCDRMRAIYKDCPPSWVDAVRAAARGEGDRPAETHGFCADDSDRPSRWCEICAEQRDHPIHSGEDDRG